MQNKRTKIVATLGPASSNPEMMEKLVLAGVNAFRLNFSHGDHSSHGQTIQRIKEIRERLQLPVAILQDLRGPKIRIGKLKGEKHLKQGMTVVLDASIETEVEGRIPVTYPDFASDVRPRTRLLLADGRIELTITRVEPPLVYCKVVNEGSLTSGKGVNYPEGSFNLPALTEKDRQDLSFGLAQGVDFVALSFVRKEEDVLQAREVISQSGQAAGLIAKIEKHEGVKNIEKILKHVDGVMVARGDLGVEVPLQEVPVIQKKIIQLCNRSGKPVITATQMLLSMVENPRPTRAEVSDIANAIWDGTDAIMLSEETAVGHYPEEAVKMMSGIAKYVERNYKYYRKIEKSDDSSIPEAISHNATLLARELSSKVILCPTHSGFTARMMSRFRPGAKIVALTPNRSTFYQLSLVWNVFPILIAFIEDTGELIQDAVKIAEKEKFIHPGEQYVITAGFPFGIGGATNFIKAGICGEQ